MFSGILIKRLAFYSASFLGKPSVMDISPDRNEPFRIFAFVGGREESVPNIRV